MTPLRLWFNETYRGTYQLIGLLRDGARPRQLVVHGSHSVASTPFLQACDTAFVEPAETGDAFVEVALEHCRRHRVDVFVPGREMAAVAGREADFASAGVAVMVSPYQPVVDLADKRTTYRQAPAHGVAVPVWHVAETVGELRAAYGDLTGRGLEVCVKPARDHGARGFRRVVERDDAGELAALAAEPDHTVGLARLEHLLASTERVAPLVVSEWLPGPEFSVDCVSDAAGGLLVAVARGKSGLPWTRELVDEPDLVETARRLVEGYRLRYLSNVQLRRRANGEPVLLEVNTRASSGLYQSCASGVNLPWLALRLLLDGTAGNGTVGEVPRPRLPASLIAMTQAIPFRPPVAPGDEASTPSRRPEPC